MLITGCESIGVNARETMVRRAAKCMIRGQTQDEVEANLGISMQRHHVASGETMQSKYSFSDCPDEYLSVIYLNDRGIWRVNSWNIEEARSVPK